MVRQSSVGLLGLVLLALTSNASAQTADLPVLSTVVTAAPLRSAPNIDGEVGEREWLEATQFGALLGDETGVVSALGRQLWVGFDEHALFFAWRIERPAGDHAEDKAHSTDEFQPGEFIELEIAVGEGPADHRRFRVYGDGTVADGTGASADPRWGCTWKHAVTSEVATWSGELALDSTCVGSLRPPKSFRFDVTVSASAESAPASSLVFRGPQRTFRASSAELRLDPDAAPALRWKRLGAAGPEHGLVELELVNAGNASGTVHAEVSVQRRKPNAAHAQPLFMHVATGSDDSFQAGATDFTKGTNTEQLVADALSAYEPLPDARLDADCTVPPHQRRTLGRMFDASWGEYLVQVRVRSSRGVVLFAATRVFRIEPPVHVEVQTYWLGLHQVHARADARGLRAGTWKNLELQVLPMRGASVLKRAPYHDLARGRAQATMDIRGLAPGHYRIATVLLGLDGKELSRQERIVEVPRAPAWSHNRLGTTTIPKPWVALHASPSGIVTVWGRRYDLRQVFPSSIRGAAGELLARPAALELISAQTLADFRVTRLRRRRSDAGRAEYAVALESSDARVEGTMTVEFDGFVWYDLTLAPKNGALHVESLSFVQSLRAEHGALLSVHRSLEDPYFGTKPASQTGTSLSGKLVERALPFSPSVWIGDEAAGLTWIAEAPTDWQIDDADHVIEVKPGSGPGTAAQLRARLIDHAVELRKPMRLQFGLQATPIREAPTPAKTQVAQFFGIFAEEAAYEALADSGCKSVVFHSGWKDDGRGTWSGWPSEPSDPERRVQLRRAVELAHKHGLKVALYTGWGVERESPEWRQFHDELARQPLENAGVGTYRQSTAQGGAYDDYVVWMIAQFIREYDVDGVFWDSTANLVAGQEVPLGTGWIDDQGRTRPGFAVRGTRSLFRRVYALTHGELKQDGLIIDFGGSLWVVNAFSDIFHRGEGTPMTAASLREAWNPLEVFRADYAGRPFGLQYVAMNKDFMHRHMTANTNNAVALLHGAQAKYAGSPFRQATAGRAYGRTDTPMLQIWRARSWLPFDEHTVWHPYYDPGPTPLARAGDAVLTSVFMDPTGRRALLVVSNLDGRSLDDVRVDIDPTRLSPAGAPLHAQDAVLEENLRLDGDRLQLRIEGESYRLIKLWKDDP